MSKKSTNYGSHAPDASVSKAKSQRFNDNQFIRYELNKDMQLACKNWAVTIEELCEALEGLVDSGYSITVKWDDFSSSYLCSIRQTQDKGKNAGFILTGRGSTGMKAIKQAFYKHFHIMDADWAAFSDVRRDGELDD